MRNYSDWGCVTDPNPALQAFGVSERATFTELARMDTFLRKDRSLWSFGCSNDYQRALDNCSPLAAIILSMAESFSNGCFEVLNYKTQNYVRGKYLPWEELLENPNPFANKIQFLQNLYINRIIYGYCYVLPIYPAGIKDRPVAMYVLPGEFLRVELKKPNQPFYTFTKGESIRTVYFSANGQEVAIDEKDLILFKDNTIGTDPMTGLPNSRLRSLHYPIGIFDSSQEAVITLVQNRGPMGFIANNSKDQLGNTPMDPKTKKEVQNDLRRYGLHRGLDQFVITNQSLGWVPVGVNIAELMLVENKSNAVKEMCGMLQYPFILTPFSDQSTYNNVDGAKKQAYQDAVIPQANGIIGQLNSGLKTHSQNIDIKVTYEDLYIFQQSIKEKGDGLRSMNQAQKILWYDGLITRNMWLKAIGIDEVPRDEFTKYKWELTPEQLGVVQQNIGNETNQSGNSGNQSGQS